MTNHHQGQCIVKHLTQYQETGWYDFCVSGINDGKNSQDLFAMLGRRLG